MEQKKRVPYTIDVKGKDGTDKQLESSCCVVIAVTQSETARMIAVDASGEDLIFLYKALIEVKTLIEDSSPNLRSFFKILELCKGELPDAD